MSISASETNRAKEPTWSTQILTASLMDGKAPRVESSKKVNPSFTVCTLAQDMTSHQASRTSAVNSTSDIGLILMRPISQSLHNSVLNNHKVHRNRHRERSNSRSSALPLSSLKQPYLRSKIFLQKSSSSWSNTSNQHTLRCLIQQQTFTSATRHISLWNRTRVYRHIKANLNILQRQAQQWSTAQSEGRLLLHST